MTRDKSDTIKPQDVDLMTRPIPNVVLGRPILDNNKKCIAKEKIYFLKIHKAASSVIEDILLRYAWTRRKTLMRPDKLSLNFPWHAPFEPWMALNHGATHA